MFHAVGIDNDITVSINSGILYFVRSGMSRTKRLTLISDITSDITRTLISEYEDCGSKMRSFATTSTLINKPSVSSKSIKIKEFGFVKIRDVLNNDFNLKSLNVFKIWFLLLGCLPFQRVGNAVNYIQLAYNWKLLLNNGDCGNHIGRVGKVEDIAGTISK